MFVPSNDFFYAPGQSGIALFNHDGSPVTGDVTDQIRLWDAGTEANQALGIGSEQPLVGGPDPSTPDSDTRVRLANNSDGNLPAVEDVVEVTLDSLSPTRFRVTITNKSTTDTLIATDGSRTAVPLTPPVWVIHTAPAPLFAEGADDYGEGLETLAETGDPSGVAAAIADRTRRG